MHNNRNQPTLLDIAQGIQRGWVIKYKLEPLGPTATLDYAVRGKGISYEEATYVLEDFTEKFEGQFWIEPKMHS